MSFSRGLLNGRVRPPRPPVDTIHEHAPVAELPATTTRVNERAVSFHGSDAHQQFLRDTQRSNSTPNAGREWRTDRAYDDRTTALPPQTGPGSMPRYNSEHHSRNTTPRSSYGEGNEVRYPAHINPAGAFAQRMSPSGAEVPPEASEQYPRSTSATSGDYHHQHNGNAGFNGYNNDSALYGRSYPLTPQPASNRCEPSRRVSEPSAFTPSYPNSMPINNGFSNQGYDQYYGRYQERPSNLGWNLQRSSVHSEPGHVSPRAITTGTSSESLGRTTYHELGTGYEHRGHNVVNSPLETQYDSACAPDATNTYQPMSNNRDQKPQASKWMTGYADRRSEDARSNDLLYVGSYREYGSYNSAENDALSLASRTTGKDSVGTASTTSEMGDHIAEPRDEGVEIKHTGIDLKVLSEHLENNETPSRYRWEVKVWQDSDDTSKLLQRRLLLLDSQCEDSNWVSERIVNDLGAKKHRLRCPAQFITFNGEVMTTEWETTLSFRHNAHKATIQAKFLVAVSGNVPFDMVLGTTDIDKYDLLGAKSLFGLGHKKQSSKDKLEQAEREKEQSIKMLKRLEKNKQDKEQKRRKDVERRNGESSSAGNNESIYGRRHS